MTNKREKTIVIVLSESEKKQIQDYAAAEHAETSTWCRGVIQRAMDDIDYQREARAARLEMIRGGEKLPPLMTENEMKETPWLP